MLPVRIESGIAVFPRLAWRWDSETDILSGAYRLARPGEKAESVEVSSADGAVVVLDAVGGEVCGLDIVIWPDVDTVTTLQAPAPQIAGRILLSPLPDGPPQVETVLGVTVDGLEQTFHLRLGEERGVTVVQVADHLLIEVDTHDRLAGFWLTSVPPFPAEE